MTSKKILLNTLIISSLSAATLAPVEAAVLDFDFDGLFTMTNGSGSPTQNTSYPYYGDTTWGYGKRTQVTGTLTFDTDTGVGTGTIAPFEFFASGPIVFHDFVINAIGDGAGGPGSLIMGNMLFDWKATNISLEIVLDAAGLFGAVVGGMAVGDTVSGVGATAATENMPGNLPMGPVPIATTTYDADGVNITGDDGIGGSPMDNGPFSGFNMNFDMTSVTMTANSSVIPVPAAAWLFGSGILGLAGFAGSRKSA